MSKRRKQNILTTILAVMCIAIFVGFYLAMRGDNVPVSEAFISSSMIAIGITFSVGLIGLAWTSDSYDAMS